MITKVTHLGGDDSGWQHDVTTWYLFNLIPIWRVTVISDTTSITIQRSRSSYKKKQHAEYIRNLKH